MAKTALITGITGQDGSYLAEFLLKKNYLVHGAARWTVPPERSRLAHLYADASIFGKRLFFHTCDLVDHAAAHELVQHVQPDEVYHLAGQSHVALSFELVDATCEAAGMAAIRLLEALRGLKKRPRLFHASSSEVFGRPEKAPQNELTPMRPASPYGCAKAFAANMVGVFRDRFGLYACNGILFNHESPRRGEDFVTQKICRVAAAIKTGRQSELVLGRLDARRDWGDARDFIYGMWLALQQERPEDYVFATGHLHTVQDVVEAAFRTLDLDWRAYVRQDPKLVRPLEPVPLVGDASKARELLGWNPSSSFEGLIAEMTKAQLQAQAV